MNPTTLAILICLLFETSLAQKRPIPRFEDYSVSTRFTGKTAPPIITGARARLYRTRIREGAKQAPNFAGHYTIVTWGCGSDCQGLAIINARTGRVYTPPEVYEAIRMPSQDNKALQYRIDSRLLIVEGWRTRAGSKGITEGKWYYKWEGNRLMLISSIKK
jgi:hypothetical protein